MSKVSPMPLQRQNISQFASSGRSSILEKRFYIEPVTACNKIVTANILKYMDCYVVTDVTHILLHVYARVKGVYFFFFCNIYKKIRNSIYKIKHLVVLPIRYKLLRYSIICNNFRVSH